MENLTGLVNQLNDLDILQKGEWIEDIPEVLWNKYFERKYEEVKTNLDPIEHRWYETTITVIKIGNEYMGIRSITKLFSERSSIEDCFCYLKFYKMKEVLVVSYEIDDNEKDY